MWRRGVRGRRLIAWLCDGGWIRLFQLFFLFLGYELYFFFLLEMMVEVCLEYIYIYIYFLSWMDVGTFLSFFWIWMVRLG